MSNPMKQLQTKKPSVKKILDSLQRVIEQIEVLREVFDPESWEESQLVSVRQHISTAMCGLAVFDHKINLVESE